ncbi:unnamed protein product, partial [Rotaria sordida]
MCSSCERNYRRKNKEEKQQHQAFVPSSPGQMNTEQSKQKIQLQQCWRIPYQPYACFICGTLLSNNSALVPDDARLDLFIDYDVYVCDKQKCCAHHLVGSHLAPDLTIDISHYESASLTPLEVTQLIGPYVKIVTAALNCFRPPIFQSSDPKKEEKLARIIKARAKANNQLQTTVEKKPLNSRCKWEQIDETQIDFPR